MKRKDLTVGMAVEIQNGRDDDYRDYRDAIVLSVDPWVAPNDGFSHYSRKAPRPADRYDKSRSGVAVAYRMTAVTHTDTGERTTVDLWLPQVVSLAKLVPAGSRSEFEKARDERRAAARSVEDARRAAAAEIAAALGVERYEVIVERSMVTVPLDALRKALGQTEESR